ncbi:PTS sugar transporter subunit IIA [Pseudostreptobacillus hongkongensis]|uniref:BglG family transcription antiterminator n=1 Tax=Pseudostreptobacillus hongkongensis TaxID=1162717 RepID=UPI0028CFE3B5|nr:PTS sugar transporter subunit IIA [Pseudostreptobacillus hongkongensis]
MLNSREIEILEILIQNPEINIDYLCEYFDISKRTIQYNISNINYYLFKSDLSKINIKDNRFIVQIKEIERFVDDLKNSNYISKEDYNDLIYLYLIFNDNGLNISQVSKRLNISRNTLKLELNNINEKLEYIHSKGYYIRIDNSSKIEILDKIYRNSHLKEFFLEIIDGVLIFKIEEFLKDISKKIKLNISSEVYKKLIFSIYCSIKYPEKSLNTFILNEDNEKIKEVFEKYFEGNAGFNFIADIIIGLSLNPNLESWLDESFLIKKMIKEVSDDIGIDLTEDKILYDFLLSHIKVSIYRLKKNIKLTNPVYEQMYINEDGILDSIRGAVSEMENIFEIKFTDIELSLIAYHFKASIDRTVTTNRKKVILVCGLGYGASRILEYNLKEKFDIDILDVLPSYMISKDIVDNKNVDYILTTVDLEFDSIKINPILQIEDYNKLELLGIKRKKDKIELSDFIEDLNEISNFNKNELEKLLLNKYSNVFFKGFKTKSTLINFLTEDKVKFVDNVKDWQEAFNILGKNMLRHKSITQEYIVEMINMVEKIGPYMVIDDGIALPHAKPEHGVLKTDVSILIIKDGVMIKDRKVYIMFCFSTINENSHLELLSDIYKLIMKDKFLKEILELKDYKQLIKYIEKSLIRR